MRTVSQIEKETDYLGFSIPSEDGEDADYLAYMSDEEIAKLAKALKISPRLIHALKSFAESLQNTVGADIEAIWRRLDKIENV